MKSYAKPQIAAARVLLPEHIIEIESSGIDFQSAAFAGAYSINNTGAYTLGIRGPCSCEGLCFPYWDVEANTFSRRFARVKPDIQILGRKYLQPVGERPRLYFVPGTSRTELADHSIPIFLVEGEKKTLSVARALAGLEIPGLTIGLGGVWSWLRSQKELQPDGKLGKGKSRPIEDLDLINWERRAIYLIFDSDVSTNWKVQAAETALAKELQSRGANVRIVRISGGGSWRKSASTT